MSEQVAASRWQKYGWLTIPVITAAAVTGSVIANANAEPQEYAQDTKNTVSFNGSVFGNCHRLEKQLELVPDGIVSTSDFVICDERLGPLSGNPPFPPYYNPADNEDSVELDGQILVGCEVYEPKIIELDARSVKCGSDYWWTPASGVLPGDFFTS